MANRRQMLVPPPPPSEMMMIGRPQVPIPSQPSQAVAPRGAEADPNIELLMNAARTDQIAFPNPLTPGIAQAGRMDPNPFGGADRVATQAQGLMDTQSDYKRTHELLDEYDKRRLAHKALEESGNAIMQQLANLGGGDTGSPFGADGGLITRMLTLKSRNRYANTQAQRLQLSGQVEALKFAEGLHQTGNANLLAEIAKYQGLGGDWKDLFKSSTGDENNDQTNERLTSALTEKIRHGSVTEGQGAGRLAISQAESPHQIDALDAMAGVRKLEMTKRTAQMPYVAPQAAANVRRTETNTAQQAPRTAAMMAGATGGLVNPEMLGLAGMEPAIGGELPLNPKAKAAIAAQDTGTALKKTQIAAAVGEKMTKDRKRAMRFASDGMGLSFWEKHNELWDVLPPEKKYEMLSKWKAGGK